MLKNNGEGPTEIIGTDMSLEAVGRYLCDRFYQVPPGSSPDYIPSMLEIVDKEEPDLVFPESSNEVLQLAKAKDDFESKGTPVVVSSPKAIETASNKFLMYEEVRKGGKVDLPLYHSASTMDELLEAMDRLGYPEKPVVFKPQFGKGSRGVRIINPKADRRHQLMDEKPTSKFMSLDEFTEIFKEIEDLAFPNFVVMEYLEGMEKTADTKP